MALKKRISAIEYCALQLNMRSLYIRDNDGYRLDVEGLPRSEAEMKAELDSARAELRSVKAETNEYRAIFGDALGDDPEKWKEKYNAILARAERGLMTKPEFDAEMARLKAEHDQRLEALRATREPELEKLREQINGQRGEQVLHDAMRRGGVIAPDLLMPILRQHVKVVGDPMDDDVEVTVVDPKTGQARVNLDGSPVAISQLLEGWRVTSPDLSRAFAEPLAHQLVGRNGNGAH